MLDFRPNPIFQPPPEQAQQQIRQRTTMRRAIEKRRLMAALHRKNAVKEISDLPAMEESLHIIARGNFPLWSIVPATLALANPAIIDALHIATLGFSHQNAADLLGLMDAGQVRDVGIVASCYFERQNPAEFKVMAEGLTHRGQRVVAIRNHAKVIAMALSDGRRFTVESSANLRSCRNIEQITLTQSPELYTFHSDWMKSVIVEATGGQG